MNVQNLFSKYHNVWCFHIFDTHFQIIILYNIFYVKTSVNKFYNCYRMLHQSVDKELLLWQNFFIFYSLSLSPPLLHLTHTHKTKRRRNIINWKERWSILYRWLGSLYDSIYLLVCDIHLENRNANVCQITLMSTKNNKLIFLIN